MFLGVRFFITGLAGPNKSDKLKRCFFLRITGYLTAEFHHDSCSKFYFFFGGFCRDFYVPYNFTLKVFVHRDQRLLLNR